jgi:hypothetical protein
MLQEAIDAGISKSQPLLANADDLLRRSKRLIVTSNITLAVTVGLAAASFYWTMPNWFTAVSFALVGGVAVLGYAARTTVDVEAEKLRKELASQIEMFRKYQKPRAISPNPSA